MPTLKHDLVIQQGATFQFTYALTGGPDSIAGFSAQLQVRPYRSSEEVYVDWNSPAEITIDAVNKQIVIEVSDEATTLYDWEQGEYDLELRGDSKTWRVAQGLARLSREVTR